MATKKLTLISMVNLLSLILMSRAFHTCEEKCPSVVQGKNICASNGNIYPDDCRAKCVSSSNYKVFDCDDEGTVSNCSSQCTQWKSTGTAPTSLISNTIPPHTHTNSGGVLVPNPGTSTSYISPNSNQTTSSSSVFPTSNSLSSVADCQSRCPPTLNSLNKLRESVCGSDGKVYDSECHGRCVSPSMSFRFTCSGFFQFSDCQVKCTQQSPNYTNPFTNRLVSSPTGSSNSNNSFLSVYNQPSSQILPNYTSSYPSPTPPVTPTQTTSSVECNEGPLVCGSNGKVNFEEINYFLSI